MFKITKNASEELGSLRSAGVVQEALLSGRRIIPGTGICASLRLERRVALRRIADAADQRRPALGLATAATHAADARLARIRRVATDESYAGSAFSEAMRAAARSATVLGPPI